MQSKRQLFSIILMMTLIAGLLGTQVIAARAAQPSGQVSTGSIQRLGSGVSQQIYLKETGTAYTSILAVAATVTPTPTLSIPDTIIDSNPSNPSNNSTANFTFHGTGGTGSLTFKCKMDAGAFSPCDTAGTQSYNSLADGSHTFQVRATDSLNKTDSTPASFTWTVDDSTEPSVVVSSTFSNPTSRYPITITITFNEAVTTFTPSTAEGDIIVGGVGGVESNATGSGTTYTFDIAPSAPGTVTVRVPSGSAKDAADNYNTSSNLFSIVYDPSLTATPTRTPKPSTSGNLIWNQSYDLKYDTWLGVKSNSAFGHGYRKATSGSFTFQPNTPFTQVNWITYRGPDQGKANIFVDDVLKTTVDLYHATAQSQYMVSIKGLSNTKHKVIIRPLNTKSAASNGKWVVVDGFTLGAAEARTVYDDQLIYMSNTFAYGSWSGVITQPGPFSGAYRISNVAGATTSFSFIGTQITWVTARGPAYGKAEIWINGVLKRTVDLYRANQEWQYKVNVSNLTYGKQNVVIKVLGSKNPGASDTGVVVDGFEINTPK